MANEQLIAQAGAAAGYELINNGSGRFSNITLNQDFWNPLTLQADAEQLAQDLGLDTQDLDTPLGRRKLVESAVDRYVRED